MPGLQNITPDDNLIFTGSTFSYILSHKQAPWDLALDFPKDNFAAAFHFLIKNKPKKNMTQEWIGERIGRSQSYIGKMARGERSGKETDRRKIAALYGYDGTGPGRTYDDFLEFGRRVRTQYQTFEQGSTPDTVNQKPPNYTGRRKTRPKSETADPPRQMIGYFIGSGGCDTDDGMSDEPLENADPEPENGGNNIHVLRQQHQNIVQAFADPRAGLEINQALIEIERLDKEEFDRIRDYVQWVRDRVRAKKIADQNSE